MPRKTSAPAEFAFRMRGKQHVTRLECFSDCVFAFALTLLVVSLEVPKSYSELTNAMRGMVAFGFCFFVLFGLWSRHHTFFRRYGLEDRTTIALTGCLLFVILGYVYPLKFLSLVTVDFWLGDSGKAHMMFTKGHEIEEVRGLFLLYGSGLVATSLLFYLFYAHALRKRTELELTEVETFDTRWFAREHLLQSLVPIFATTLAYVLPPDEIGVAGFSYFLYAVTGFMHGSMHGKGRRELIERQAPSGP